MKQVLNHNTLIASIVPRSISTKSTYQNVGRLITHERNRLNAIW
ncbi:5103_t:CDS:2 [Ambispora gerdemannii]|uniref:5103_t:CDS:1 n=1 Tax=Ambispora gerdemannii TaxID=144530 RepID=A0A9N9AZ62_9GLOM|nr:5103_t:CDS:2 [Ambispora gerdemannii]